MARLVMVSNRLLAPRERVSRAGGLAIALRDALQRRGGIWFGWSGEVVDSPAESARMTTAGRITYATLDLSQDDYDTYYIGYANSTLWPLCHYRLGLIEFRRAAFRGYQRVNANFAKALLPLLRPDDVIWVHDYHLIPLGAELRKLGVTNRIGFFLHIPFPAKEVFLALPDHLALARALTHYDLVGFQTQNDVDAFLGYLEGETGARLLSNGQFEAFGRTTQAQALPIGIDTDAFAETARIAASAPETVRLARSLSGRSLVIGVDRLDYSKGLPRKIEALGELLEHRPEHRGKVTYLQISPSSRDSVAQYRALRREIDSVAGRVNGRYAEFDWAPVRYLNKGFSRGTLAGFYRVARVGFVAPLRDGMNLVAKEYVAAQDPQDPGALILSRFAGAAHELETALIVNPFDLDSLADALHRGLTMPLSERIARWEPMFDALRMNPISAWCDRFLTMLGGEVSDRPQPRNIVHSAAIA